MTGVADRIVPRLVAIAERFATGDIEYVIRRSSRARRASLRVSARDGASVVLPTHVPASVGHELVASRRDWLEAITARLATDRAKYDEIRTQPIRPTTIDLRALEVTLEVHYEHRVERTVVRERDGVVTVFSAKNEAEDRDALLSWLTRRARLELEPWARALALERSMIINAVAIRAQQSRWASCSATGRLNLNRTLLFLPPELVRHVLLHELCHLKELNHSARFWRLLESEDDACAIRRAELAKAWRYVPRWATKFATLA